MYPGRQHKRLLGAATLPRRERHFRVVTVAGIVLAATVAIAIMTTIPSSARQNSLSSMLDSTDPMMDSPSDMRAKYWSNNFQQNTRTQQDSPTPSVLSSIPHGRGEVKVRSTTVPDSPRSGQFEDENNEPNPIVDSIPAQLSVREGLLGQRIQDLESHGESVTIMCVGESGVGKSTLLSNIFTVPIVHSVPKPTVKIVETSVKFECDGIPITVHLIDTPGYGDAMDMRKSFSYVKDYLETRFQQSLKRELQVERHDRHVLDNLLGVDAILYFFSPHRCKTVDLEFLKSIQGYATIIPILAKADTMTADELAEFRSTVIKKLKETGIKTFHTPFAIISSPYVVRSHSNSRGDLIHGREYPWGTAESENELHSDLPALRRCLITEGLSELHECTRRYFERYRANKLTEKNSVLQRVRRAVVTFLQTALFIFAAREAPRTVREIIGGNDGYLKERNGQEYTIQAQYDRRSEGGLQRFIR